MAFMFLFAVADDHRASALTPPALFQRYCSGSLSLSLSLISVYHSLAWFFSLSRSHSVCRPLRMTFYSLACRIAAHFTIFQLQSRDLLTLKNKSRTHGINVAVKVFSNTNGAEKVLVDMKYWQTGRDVFAIRTA